MIPLQDLLQNSAVLPHHPNSLQHSSRSPQTPSPLLPPPRVLYLCGPFKSKLISARNAFLLASIRSRTLCAGSHVDPVMHLGQPVTPGLGYPQFTIPDAYSKRKLHSSISRSSAQPISTNLRASSRYKNQFQRMIAPQIPKRKSLQSILFRRVRHIELEDFCKNQSIRHRFALQHLLFY